MLGGNTYKSNMEITDANIEKNNANIKLLNS